MKFENSFTVAAPLDEVWETLLDVERVAPCMPGAEVLERSGDDAYRVGIKVRLGPISMMYRGQVEITERDEEARHATMRARAKETRGQGTADATVNMLLAERPTGTRATLETELQLSGRAAAMGRGVIVDVAQRLVEEFANNLATMLVAQPVAVGAATATIPDGSARALAPDAPAPEAPPTAPTIATPAAAPTTERPPAAAPTTEPPPAAAATDNALPAGQIAADVIAGRLRKPRTLLIATGAVAVLGGAIGYAIGRAR